MLLGVLNAAPWSVLTWCDAHSIAVWPIMLAAHVVGSSVLTGVLYVLPRGGEEVVLCEGEGQIMMNHATSA